MEDDYIKMENYAELDYLKMESLCVGKTKQNQLVSSEDNSESKVETRERTELLQDKTRRSVNMQNLHHATLGSNEFGSIKQTTTDSDEDDRKFVHEENTDIFFEKGVYTCTTLLSPNASTECVYAHSSKQVVKTNSSSRIQQTNEIKENEEKNQPTLCGIKNESCQQHPDVGHPNNSLVQTHSQKEHKLVCTGMTTIEGDKIVIVTDNGQVLVLSNEGLFLFLREFDESFGDVTAVSDNEIAASCGFRVRFFVIHDTDIKEREEKSINFQYEETTVHGISYNARKLLMSCNLQSVISSQQPLLKLYDVKRRIANTIASSQFNFPGRVLLNSDASKIFVADQVNKTITCLDTSGTVLWETTEANSPTSFVLSKDFLHVAFEKSMELKCFSLNGNFLKSVTAIDCLASKTLLLAKNSSCLILCPSEHVIGDMSNFVFFAYNENVHKHNLVSRQTYKNMLRKLFPWKI